LDGAARMKPTFCYWSVAEGSDAALLSRAIASARRAGVEEDIHVWSPEPVPEASQHHPCGALEREGGIFKFVFLQRAVQELKYDYYVWLEPDDWFVRHPGDLSRVMQGSPVHACLESNFAGAPHAARPLWGANAQVIAALMRAGGVRSQALFTVDAGMFIVRQTAVDRVYELAREFWIFCRDHGFRLGQEPLLSFVTHMLCGNPYAHTLERWPDLWAADRTGHFRDQVPDGRAWSWSDGFPPGARTVNPAIIRLPGCEPACREVNNERWLEYAHERKS